MCHASCNGVFGDNSLSNEVHDVMVHVYENYYSSSICSWDGEMFRDCTEFEIILHFEIKSISLVSGG